MTAVVLMWGPLYIALTIYVVFWLRKKTKRVWPSMLAVAASIAWPVGDVYWSKYVISQYCEQYEGVKIYEVAEGIDGIFLSEGQGCSIFCRGDLLNRRGAVYKFVEADARVDAFRRVLFLGGGSPGGQYEDALVPGPGLYRFTLETKGHPRCKIYDAWLARRKGLQSDPFYADQCIATWPISRVTAEYVVLREVIREETITGTVDIYVRSAKRLSDDFTMFESRRHTLHSNLFWSRFTGAFQCAKRDDHLVTYRDVLKSVVPSSSNKNGTR